MKKLDKIIILAIVGILCCGICFSLMEKQLDKPSIKTFVVNNFHENDESEMDDIHNIHDDEESFLEWIGF